MHYKRKTLLQWKQYINSSILDFWLTYLCRFLPLECASRSTILEVLSVPVFNVFHVTYRTKLHLASCDKWSHGIWKWLLNWRSDSVTKTRTQFEGHISPCDTPSQNMLNLPFLFNNFRNHQTMEWARKMFYIQDVRTSILWHVSCFLSNFPLELWNCIKIKPPIFYFSTFWKYAFMWIYVLKGFPDVIDFHALNIFISMLCSMTVDINFIYS
jgi:hypothetical protein